MDPNEENAAVVEETTAPVEETTTAPVEGQEPNTETTEGGETVETSQPVTEPQTQEEEIDWSQYVPKISAPLPTNDQGQVDPQQFREQMKQELRFEQQQVREWTRLETQHPEIKSDEGIRKMILANQILDVQSGGKGSLNDAAKLVFDRIGTARNEGKASQQASVTVQKSAALQKPGAAKPSNANADTLNRIRQGDQGAIHSQLSEWIEAGKI